MPQALRSQRPSPDVGSASALTLAGVAALLSSACCVLPLVFVLVGISGAWIGRLRVLEPYSTALSVLAFAALALAAWRLYRPAAREACAVEGGPDCQRVGAATRRWFWLVVLLTLVPIAVSLAAPLFY